MYDFGFDRVNGVLHASVRGFWSLHEANRYAQELEVHAREARRVAGRLKLLIDSTEHGVQSPEVMQRLAEIRTKAIRTPKDRIAVCLVSNLARRQVARTIDNSQVALFSDAGAAREWLLGRGEAEAA